MLNSIEDILKSQDYTQQILNTLHYNKLEKVLKSVSQAKTNNNTTLRNSEKYTEDKDKKLSELQSKTDEGQVILDTKVGNFEEQTMIWESNIYAIFKNKYRLFHTTLLDLENEFNREKSNPELASEIRLNIIFKYIIQEYANIIVLKDDKITVKSYITFISDIIKKLLTLSSYNENITFALNISNISLIDLNINKLKNKYKGSKMLNEERFIDIMTELYKTTIGLNAADMRIVGNLLIILYLNNNLVFKESTLIPKRLISFNETLYLNETITKDHYWEIFSSDVKQAITQTVQLKDNYR